MSKNRPVQKPFKDTLKPLRPLLPSPSPSSSAVQEPITHRTTQNKGQPNRPSDALYGGFPVHSNKRTARLTRPMCLCIQCNGVRPTCYHCKVKGIDCIYRVSGKDTLKQKSYELTKTRITSNIFQALQTYSDHDAARIYRHIRDGNDLESVSRHIEIGDIKFMSQTKHRYIFPYRAQMPTYLRTPDNSYLDPLAHKWPQESSAQSGARPGLKEASADKSQPIQYLMPYGAADLVEPRLDYCMPSEWTSVSSDDNLIREVLKFYFLYEFPSAPFFHKDLFLDDMLAATGRFCTPLLVNAVLAHACHYYNRFTNRAEYWYPHMLGYKFLGEAKPLLELELMRDRSITSIQAILILNCVLNFSGLDRIGLTYMRLALDMGRNLGLLDSPGEANDANVLRNRVFTAWCLFNWQSLICYYMVIHPSADGVPWFDLPDPKEHVDWVNLVAMTQNKAARYRPNFETIIRAYYLRHGFETSDMMLTLFLSFLAFDFVDKVKMYFETPQDLGLQGSHKMLPDLVMEEIRSTLILAQKGLIEQGESYYLPQTVAHLVLADVDEDIAKIILDFTGVNVEDVDARQLRAQHIEACLPVKWTSFSETPNHKRLNSLLQIYAAIMTR
ncbi:hypothetical protein S40293_10150 [Stachybotrys chartarum IBT 40293]|nr:hypothetical protein S40293_10150 [Stachybotrys chartarum IBT 40293]